QRGRSYPRFSRDLLPSRPTAASQSRGRVSGRAGATLLFARKVSNYKPLRRLSRVTWQLGALNDRLVLATGRGDVWAREVRKTLRRPKWPGSQAYSARLVSVFLTSWGAPSPRWHLWQLPAPARACRRGSHRILWCEAEVLSMPD